MGTRLHSLILALSATALHNEQRIIRKEQPIAIQRHHAGFGEGEGRGYDFAMALSLQWDA